MSEADVGTQLTARNFGWPAYVPRPHEVDDTWKAIVDALKDVLEKGDVRAGLRVQ